jgi:hypothetical protein
MAMGNGGNCNGNNVIHGSAFVISLDPFMTSRIWGLFFFFFKFCREHMLFVCLIENIGKFLFL